MATSCQEYVATRLDSVQRLSSFVLMVDSLLFPLAALKLPLLENLWRPRSS